MNEKKFDSMAYLLYESDMARCERIIKRQWVLCIVLGLGLIVSNLLWMLV